ncbi:MAG: 5'-3' exonuclease [Acidothermus cellulolyticus]|nr:5'-3' exonuclease [Acidothermus cellulolyticus]
MVSSPSTAPPRPPVGKLLAVDAASLYFRAFYGVPERFAARDGTPVNAVRGLLDALVTLIRLSEPEFLAVCLDPDWRPAFRVAALPAYKAHRAASDGSEIVPPELAVQIPLIPKMLQALGIPVVAVPGFEADDALATLAARHPGPVDIATGDRDLFQVVDDAKPVRVLYVQRGVRDAEVVDDGYVRHRYGVPASSYADFAMLRGDPSDGLPGIPGVGEKTAARLLRTFGSVDALLAACAAGSADVPARLRERISSAASYLAAAETVVTVRRDVPIDTAPVPVGGVRPAADLGALADELGLAGPVHRLLNALGHATGAARSHATGV